MTKKIKIPIVINEEANLNPSFSSFLDKKSAKIGMKEEEIAPAIIT